MFKEYFKGKKAILMDLDGTIVNSHLIWNLACEEVAKNLGFTWRGINFFSEPSLTKIWSSYLDFTGEDYGVPVETLVMQTKDKFITKIMQLPPEDIMKEGFWTFINEVKNVRQMQVGLVTNSDRDVAEKVLNHCGISKVFAVKVFGDDVKKKKPDPDIYKKAIKELGLKSSEILCFEDSPLGIKSAKKAGLDVIVFMNRLYSEKEYSSDALIVDDFTAFMGNFDKTPKEFVEAQLLVPENTPLASNESLNSGEQ